MASEKPFKLKRDVEKAFNDELNKIEALENTRPEVAVAEYQALIKNEQYQGVRALYQTLVRLARCYEKGIGVQKDEEQALRWYEEAAEKGSGEARVRLGIYYEKRGAKEGNLDDLAKAASYYETAISRNNDANAKYYLAQCYERGRCYKDKNDKDGKKISKIEINLLEAERLYTEAGMAGFTIATFALGRHYERRASDVKIKDKKKELQLKAFKSYDQVECHAPKNLHAKYHVGRCYEEGIGVKKDIKRARSYYETAANGKHPSAQYRLACLYMRGDDGIEVDAEKAQALFTAAASQKHPGAIAHLQRTFGFELESSIEKPKDADTRPPQTKQQNVSESPKKKELIEKRKKPEADPQPPQQKEGTKKPISTTTSHTMITKTLARLTQLQPRFLQKIEAFEESYEQRDLQVELGLLAPISASTKPEHRPSLADNPYRVKLSLDKEDDKEKRTQKTHDSDKTDKDSHEDRGSIPLKLLTPTRSTET